VDGHRGFHSVDEPAGDLDGDDGRRYGGRGRWDAGGFGLGDDGLEKEQKVALKGRFSGRLSEF
jgi:hypothetical protein